VCCCISTTTFYILTTTTHTHTHNRFSNTPPRKIDAKLVQIDDVLKILPGAQIPADGVVIQGESFVDESMLTGESMPVRKRSGNRIYGGTINKNGTMMIRASRVGASSAIAQIAKLVQTAQTSKAPIQRYADQIAGVFAPCVVTFSVITFIVWVSLTESGAVRSSISLVHTHTHTHTHTHRYPTTGSQTTRHRLCFHFYLVLPFL
jgi:P-type Cu+ transporter